MITPRRVVLSLALALPCLAGCDDARGTPQLAESILQPQAKIVAGYAPIMPTFQGRVSEEELLQIIAYIRSLGKG